MRFEDFFWLRCGLPRRHSIHRILHKFLVETKPWDSGRGAIFKAQRDIVIHVGPCRRLLAGCIRCPKAVVVDNVDKVGVTHLASPSMVVTMQ